MADLDPVPSWDDIYLIASTDPVQGDLDGIDNLPHQALANRTEWLKKMVGNLKQQIISINGNVTIGSDKAGSYLGFSPTCTANSVAALPDPTLIGGGVFFVTNSSVSNQSLSYIVRDSAGTQTAGSFPMQPGDHAIVASDGTNYQFFATPELLKRYIDNEIDALTTALDTVINNESTRAQNVESLIKNQLASVILNFLGVSYDPNSSSQLLDAITNRFGNMSITVNYASDWSWATFFIKPINSNYGIRVNIGRVTGSSGVWSVPFGVTIRQLATFGQSLGLTDARNVLIVTYDPWVSGNDIHWEFRNLDGILESGDGFIITFGLSTY